jgi:simple sugar transport system ATP-binding protein
VTAILEATELGKQFPGVVALENVDLQIESGRVLAIVGANGAGKSTLIKILTGYYDQYDGHIRIDGQGVTLHHPADAQRLGVHAVYQEVDTVLVPTLTVSENLLLNRFADAQQGAFVDWRDLHRLASAALSRIGLDIDPRRRVDELVLHEKQMLVIARAVSQNVRVLVFDEPTTSLSDHETRRLFEIIQSLKAAGVGIVYISHRLPEVAEIADDVVVLRGGRKITQFPGHAFDLEQVTAAMLGTALTELYPPKPVVQAGALVLEVDHLQRSGALSVAHLRAHQGEILGIAGLVGAGKTELLRALFGADRVDSGAVRLDGRAISLQSPTEAVRAGIFLVPEERRAQGVLVEDPLYSNISLPFLGQFVWLKGIVNRVRERQHATSIIHRLGITPPNPNAVVHNLSGGNQQKVAVGKWLAGSARLMLFDEATQGIDLRAKHDVYLIARQIAESAAVIFASSDIDEIVGVADRAVVMRDGAIVAELSGAQLDRSLILEYATGARAPQSIATGA